jgi:hypothetical protein
VSITGYSIKIIWKYRTYNNMKRTKATFLRRTLEASKYTLTRVAYFLAGMQCFMEDFKRSGIPKPEIGSEETERQAKEDDVTPEFSRPQ